MSIRQFQDLLASQDDSYLTEMRQVGLGELEAMGEDLDPWSPWG